MIINETIKGLLIKKFKKIIDAQTNNSNIVDIVCVFDYHKLIVKKLVAITDDKKQIIINLDTII